MTTNIFVRRRFIINEFESIDEIMTSSFLKNQYADVFELLKVVNDFIKNQRYVVVIRNFKWNKKDEKTIAYFCCTKNQKVKNNTSKEDRNVVSKRTDCFFQIVAKLENNTWTFKRINIETHNHEESAQFFHTRLRNQFMKRFDVQKNILAQYKVNQKSSKILSFINIKYDSDDLDDSIIEIRDISNALQLIRANEIDNKIFIQIFNVYLQSNFDQWWARVKLDSMTKKIFYMYWINKTFMNMLRVNEKVMIVDCIYKINRYRMSLIICTEITCLNTFFYAEQVFFKDEKLNDYKWFFAIIKNLYKHLDISFSIVWLSNDELNISTAIAEEISSIVKHALCVWHLKQNIAVNCKKYFSTNEIWFVFFGEYNKKIKIKNTRNIHRLLYVDNQQNFDSIWQEFQDTYNFVNENICFYLKNNLLTKKKKWCKIWINFVMHFDHSTTFIDESNNVLLKKKLMSFQRNLKTIIDIFNIICDRQRNNYIVAFEIVKERLNHKLRKIIYRDVEIYVTSFALKKIDDQYKKLLKTKKKNINLSVCTRFFKEVMNFFCAHVIEERRANFENEKILKLIDIHSHWKFKKSIRHYNELDEFVNVDDDENDIFVQNSLLQIQNSTTMFTKNRFRKSQNRNKIKTTGERNRTEERQRVFDNFIRRKFSRFEYNEIIDFISSVQISFNQSFSSSQSSFVRFTSSQFIRSFTFYFEFSMFDSFFTSYFQQRFQFDSSISIQSLSNQMYSQWFNQMYSQLISTQNHSTTTETKRSQSEKTNEKNTKRMKR